jgi:hypothetical protein
MMKCVLSEVSEKGWNKLNNVGDIKEGEVKALFNLIDKDKSGELSLDVNMFSSSHDIAFLSF